MAEQNQASLLLRQELTIARQHADLARDALQSLHAEVRSTESAITGLDQKIAHITRALEVMGEKVDPPQPT